MHPHYLQVLVRFASQDGECRERREVCFEWEQLRAQANESSCISIFCHREGDAWCKRVFVHPNSRWLCFCVHASQEGRVEEGGVF